LVVLSLCVAFTTTGGTTDAQESRQKRLVIIAKSFNEKPEGAFGNAPSDEENWLVCLSISSRSFSSALIVDPVCSRRRAVPGLGGSRVLSLLCAAARVDPVEALRAE
jgi:hypothetical protein